MFKKIFGFFGGKSSKKEEEKEEINPDTLWESAVKGMVAEQINDMQSALDDAAKAYHDPNSYTKAENARYNFAREIDTVSDAELDGFYTKVRDHFAPLV